MTVKLRTLWISTISAIGILFLFTGIFYYCKEPNKSDAVPSDFKVFGDLTANNLPLFVKGYYDYTLRGINENKALGASEIINTIHSKIVASSMGETLYRFGAYEGGTIIRESTQEVLSTLSLKQKEKLGLQEVRFDKGILKKDELNAFIMLANHGFEKELRARLADKKIEKAPGEKDRFNYWR